MYSPSLVRQLCDIAKDACSASGIPIGASILTLFFSSVVKILDHKQDAKDRLHSLLQASQHAIYIRALLEPYASQCTEFSGIERPLKHIIAVCKEVEDMHSEHQNRISSSHFKIKEKVTIGFSKKRTNIDSWSARVSDLTKAIQGLQLLAPLSSLRQLTIMDQKIDNLQETSTTIDEDGFRYYSRSDLIDDPDYTIRFPAPAATTIELAAKLSFVDRRCKLLDGRRVIVRRYDSKDQFKRSLQQLKILRLQIPVVYRIAELQGYWPKGDHPFVVLSGGVMRLDDMLERCQGDKLRIWQLRWRCRFDILSIFCQLSIDPSRWRFQGFFKQRGPYESLRIFDQHGEIKLDLEDISTRIGDLSTLHDQSLSIAMSQWHVRISADSTLQKGIRTRNRRTGEQSDPACGINWKRFLDRTRLGLLLDGFQLRLLDLGDLDGLDLLAEFNSNLRHSDGASRSSANRQSMSSNSSEMCTNSEFDGEGHTVRKDDFQSRTLIDSEDMALEPLHGRVQEVNVETTDLENDPYLESTLAHGGGCSHATVENAQTLQKPIRNLIDVAADAALLPLRNERVPAIGEDVNSAPKHKARTPLLSEPIILAVMISIAMQIPHLVVLYLARK